jgi:hypothetical protein
VVVAGPGGASWTAAAAAWTAAVAAGAALSPALEEEGGGGKDLILILMGLGAIRTMHVSSSSSMSGSRKYEQFKETVS